MKCQHQILGIRWSDFISNVDVQARKGLTTRRWAKSWQPVASRCLDTLPGLRVTFLRTWRSAGTSICRLVVLLVPTGDDALVDPALDGQTRFDGTRAVHQWNSGGVPSSVGATQLEMCMGMGTIGIPCVLWDFHGNGSDNDYIMGIGMGVGIKV